MADVFISYASPDRERARLLADRLEQQGWSVWWDREIQPGRPFDDAIEEALNSALCVIVLWSNDSVKSDWVKAEASEAADKRLLVPAVIDRVRIPLQFRRFQAADLTGWTGATDDVEFGKLLASVARLIDRPVQSTGRPLHMPPDRGHTAGSGFRWRLAVAAFVILVVAAAIAAWTWTARIDVPSVAGQSLNQAIKSIAAAGLTTGVVTHEPSTESPLGTVLQQDPAPGATATKGTAVALVVAAPKAPSDVVRNDPPPSSSSVRPTPPEVPGLGIGFDSEELGLNVTFIADDSSLHAFLADAKGPGALVLVVKAGPAQRAGMQAGDVITKIAGAPIGSVNDLRVALRKIGPGITRFTIRRGETELTLNVDCPVCRLS